MRRGFLELGVPLAILLAIGEAIRQAVVAGTPIVWRALFVALGRAEAIWIPLTLGAALGLGHWCLDRWVMRRAVRRSLSQSVRSRRVASHLTAQLPPRLLLAIAIADTVITAAAAFADNTLGIGTSGPRAPWTFWLTKPVAWMLIAPIAAFVVWRSIAQLRRQLAGPEPGWCLAAELVIAAAILSLAALPLGVGGLLSATVAALVFAAVIGVCVTCVNVVAWRRLTAPRATRRSV